MKKFIILVWVGCWLSGTLSAQDVSLTVYNQNLALVREVREMSIASGVSTVAFTDVAARIDPTSVHFKSLSAPEKLTLMEQNFEYDLVSARKILEKYVDEEIRLVMEKGEVFEGKLLSASDSDIVIQNDEGRIKVIQGEGVQHFDFPKLPEGLITRPTLVWMVQNQGPGRQKAEVSYLTNGVNWHAEYVAVVDEEDKNLDLGGWVSIENRSGATYGNAKLKLVAGDVHRVKPKRRRAGEDDAVAPQILAKAAAPQFEEKAFFEYHLYTLQRRTTLKDNQTKQISLFPPAETKTEKIFIHDGSRYGKKVRVHLEFKNSEKDGLGIPLPQGKIRVYKEDVDHALEFVGEDLIDHTPVDEKVRIFLGNAFDLVGERVQKSSKKISDRVYEREIEVSLRNRKEEDVEIVVVEHFYGDWKISNNSHSFVKKDAWTAEFPIAVPARGEVTLSYTATIQW